MDSKTEKRQIWRYLQDLQVGQDKKYFSLFLVKLLKYVGIVICEFNGSLAKVWWPEQQIKQQITFHTEHKLCKVKLINLKPR